MILKLRKLATEYSSSVTLHQIIITPKNDASDTLHNKVFTSENNPPNTLHSWINTPEIKKERLYITKDLQRLSYSTSTSGLDVITIIQLILSTNVPLICKDIPLDMVFIILLISSIILLNVIFFFTLEFIREYNWNVILVTLFY